MDPLDVVSAVLILLGIINVIATVILVHGAWVHRWPALVERAVVAVVLTIAGACIAGLAFARLDHVLVPHDVATFFLVLPFVLMSLPAVIWLTVYMLGRFDQ